MVGGNFVIFFFPLQTNYAGKSLHTSIIDQGKKHTGRQRKSLCIWSLALATVFFTPDFFRQRKPCIDITY